MGERKRVLIVKPILPYPPDQGTRIVTFDLILALREQFDVTVLCRILDRSEQTHVQALSEYCRVEAVMAPNRKSLFHRAAYKIAYGIKGLARGRSKKSLYDCPGAFRARARELAREEFDLVIVEYWQLFEMFEIFPRDKTVLLTHDIDLLVNRQAALLEKRIIPKMRAVRKWRTEEGEEVRAYQKSSRVWALTERDAHAVRKLSKQRAGVSVLPFGVDPERFDRAVSNVQRSPNEVLFMGAMRAGFNRDALEFFVEKIYPHLDGLDARYTVAGGQLPDRVAHFGRLANVSLVGHVPEVGELLGRAACMVVPLRYGGGLRIRILEAMMARLPVVCTSVAIAGMDFEPGTHFLLADDPAEFADQVRRVVETPGLGEQLAAAARERVEEQYARPVQWARTRALVQAIVTK